ncbi:hypothetical protein D9M73_295630 [compost metagenome]
MPKLANASNVIVTTRVNFLPRRSAIRPKNQPPKGLATKPPAKMAKVDSKAEVGSAFSKKFAAR